LLGSIFGVNGLATSMALALQCLALMALVSDPLVHTVIGCAIEVHRALGPGLLEGAYRPCLAKEFRDKGIRYVTELTIPVCYKGETVDCAYRLDFLIEDWLVLEIKSVERIIPAHRAQVITYVRLVRARQGLIFNFHAARMKDGIVSVLAPEAMVDADSGGSPATLSP
jgi:GxxExxY protein